MKIEVLHESEHYVMVVAPMTTNGTAPTRADILSVYEALRQLGLRPLDLHAPGNDRPALICERIGSLFSDNQRFDGTGAHGA